MGAQLAEVEGTGQIQKLVVQNAFAIFDLEGRAVLVPADADRQSVDGNPLRGGTHDQIEACLQPFAGVIVNGDLGLGIAGCGHHLVDAQRRPVQHHAIGNGGTGHQATHGHASEQAQKFRRTHPTLPLLKHAGKKIDSRNRAAVMEITSRLAQDARPEHQEVC
ncbi:hypothetical protein SAMN05444959_105180 [Paracoccus seriniphilus]|uniref:Uncharacterized protein n=1 Tax=Paracoccus seriniphilus TaxID=184748 RepID=A0A239PTW7_9RHOB|nr:hypothetical protein [Paracoccus seriniphilus]SNT73734.1 hypothetical protein SAMN05444959_105180 [Paracoccus seriniphilus]